MNYVREPRELRPHPLVSGVTEDPQTPRYGGMIIWGLWL